MAFILTIDDSPTVSTNIILDFLAKKKIRAVFFCIGENMNKFPQTINRMIDEDHIVANHSYSHKRFSKILNIKEEIEKTDSLIERFYKLKGKKRVAKYFRFPYQDKGMGFNPVNLILKNYSKKYILAQSILKSLGYKNFPEKYLNTKNPAIKYFMQDHDVFTNLNLKDWKNGRLKKILRKIDKLDFEFNYIVQLHDIPNNPERTIKIIKKFIENGAEFSLPEGETNGRID